MARFSGVVGYGKPTKIRPGVTDNVITRRICNGTVKRNSRFVSEGDTVLGTVSFQTVISVVADAYALENYMFIQFVHKDGAYWQVTAVKVSRPRLELTLGGVYNGPTA